MTKSARDCQSMSDIREEIDRLDRELMELFAERWTYITRAAEIKKPIGLEARIEDRVEQVAGNVYAHAKELGLKADVYEAMWRKLIDSAIAHEEDLMDKNDRSN